MIGHVSTDFHGCDAAGGSNLGAHRVSDLFPEKRKERILESYQRAIYFIGGVNHLLF